MLWDLLTTVTFTSFLPGEGADVNQVCAARVQKVLQQRCTGLPL
jgi:hypothetical protein